VPQRLGRVAAFVRPRLQRRAAGQQPV